MKKWEKYLMYVIPVVGIGALLYLMSRQQLSQAVAPTTAPAAEITTPYDTGIPPAMGEQAQAPAPAGQEPPGMVEAEVEEQGMVEVTQTYTTQQEQDCAYAWLTQSCPTYQEMGCYSASLTSHTMTGDGTHYFRYTANYFKEGTWGVPVPATMTFTVLIKNCQVISHTYRT